MTNKTAPPKSAEPTAPHAPPARHPMPASTEPVAEVARVIALPGATPPAAPADSASSPLPLLDAAAREATLLLWQEEQGNMFVQRTVAPEAAVRTSIQRAAAPGVTGRLSVQRHAGPHGPGGKHKAGNAGSLISAQFPNLKLPADKLDTLQKVLDNRASIDDLNEEMQKYPTAASDDTAKREELNRKAQPMLEFNFKNTSLFVPTEILLGDDILFKDKEGKTQREIICREQLYKTLISSSTQLEIGAGLEPNPLFTFKWGRNRWIIGTNGGRIMFTHVLGITDFNLAYQKALLGDMKELTEHMLEISREAGKMHDMSGKKVGEVWGYVWNTTVKVGPEIGKVGGYYNDARGRVELDQTVAKAKGARITLMAPDNFLHVYSLDPDLASTQLTNPIKDLSSGGADGYVYLLAKGSAVSGVTEIITKDGRVLEYGSGEGGAGWRTKQDINEYEQFAIGAILGDAFEDGGTMATFGQIVIGCIPIVGQIADARDVAVGIHKIWASGGKDGKVQTALALIGFVPLIGDGIKRAYKGLKGEIKPATKEAAKELGRRATQQALAEGGEAAKKQLAETILKNADEVAAAFKISKEEAQKLMQGLRDMAEKAAKGDPDAVKAFAEEIGKHLDAAGGNAGSVVAMSGGKWKAVVGILGQTAEGAKVGERMQAWRVAQFDALEKKMLDKSFDFSPDLAQAGRPNMVRTGTPSFKSDVDVSFLGPGAATHKNAAIREMERAYGPAWKDMMDADIFADPARLHMFEDPLRKVGGTAAKQAEKRIVKEAELNVLAKMLENAAHLPLAQQADELAKVRKLAAEMGADMTLITARQAELKKLGLDYVASIYRRGNLQEAEKLAKDMGLDMADVVKHAQSGEDIYRQLELKLDVLHRQYLDAAGDAAKQAQIAEEMAQIQGKLNAAIPGPYVTPGGVARHTSRRELPLRPKGGYFTQMSPAMGYMSCLDDLAMLQKAMADINVQGFTEKNAKDMAKYTDRLMISAGQFGVAVSDGTRALFDQIGGLLQRSRIEKNAPALEEAIGLLGSAKAQLDGSLNKFMKEVKNNADEYLKSVSPPEASAASGWFDKMGATILRQIGIVARAEIRKEPESQQSPAQPQGTPTP